MLFQSINDGFLILSSSLRPDNSSCISFCEVCVCVCVWGGGGGVVIAGKRKFRFTYCLPSFVGGKTSTERKICSFIDCRLLVVRKHSHDSSLAEN